MSSTPTAGQHQPMVAQDLAKRGHHSTPSYRHTAKTPKPTMYTSTTSPPTTTAGRATDEEGERPRMDASNPKRE
jgi:hypothetical protein